MIPPVCRMPAFSYWMPLASLLAAAGMALTGETDFFSARLVFLLLAGLRAGGHGLAGLPPDPAARHRLDGGRIGGRLRAFTRFTWA